MLASIAKITRPDVSGSGILMRKRLFRLLDGGSRQPVTWLTAPAGSGKTTLAAGYIAERGLPCLWYKVDAGDDDAATFFYYMGLAANKAAPRHRKHLPLLTPEYLPGLPVFTLRYFEELYRRVRGNRDSKDQEVKRARGQAKTLGKRLPDASKPRPLDTFCIVLDNYQEVPASSMLHEILCGGMDIVPEGIRFIVISRTGPPEAFSRMRASDSLNMIGSDELFLSEEETAEIMRLKGNGSCDGECVRKVHGMTRGWTAGVVLLLENLKKGGSHFDSVKDAPLDNIFDYFASEILKKTGHDTQMFLLKTSFLPDMDLKLTELLAGTDDSEKILSELARSNLFTERRSRLNTVYGYHPLFREFLLAKAKSVFNKDEILLLQKKAASLLMESGRTEDAALLLRDAGDWEDLIGLILTNAQLLAKQGRLETIKGWIAFLPGEVIEGIPWILYWKAVCNLSNLPESRAHFQKAFDLFRSQNDPVGIFLSWSGAVDTYLFEMNDFTPLDYWIDWLDGYMRTRPPFPSPEIEAIVSSSMTGALMMRRVDHPDVGNWVACAESSMNKAPGMEIHFKVCTNALFYYIWIGDAANSRRLVNELDKLSRSGLATPLYIIVSKLWKTTFYSMMSLSHDSVIQAISEGIELAQKSGVYSMNPWLLANGAYSSILHGKAEPAENYLGQMNDFIHVNQRYFICHYNCITAMYYNLLGDFSRSLGYARTAMQIAEEIGSFSKLAAAGILAIALNESGQYEEAEAVIADALNHIRRANGRIYEFTGMLIQAWIALNKTEREKGSREAEKRSLELLQKTLALGRQHGFTLITVGGHRSLMSRLLSKALEKGIEVEYASDLIRNIYRYTEIEPVDTGNWPWPLKIYTLGKFRIERDGKPLIFSGKVQKKPLEMLMVLIALGGKEIREDSITDALWPEAEGDTARFSFKSSLNRLRQLLGHDEALKMSDGRLTLNPRYCRVDAWMFQRRVNSAGALMSKRHSAGSGDDGEPLLMLEKAVELYKGHFLSDEKEQRWMISLRERLKAIYLKSVIKLARYYEENGLYEKAIDCCEKGLEVDNLAEEFYRQLMVCYQRSGRASDAFKVYKRCERMLSTVLGIEPSHKTKELYSEMSKRAGASGKTG